MINIFLLVSCVVENPTIQGKVIQKLETAAEKPINKIQVEKKEVESKKDLQIKIVENKTKEKSQNLQNLSRLEDDINEVMETLYAFKRDPSYPNYIRSNEMKYYVLDTISDGKDFISKPEEFCDKYCAKNWNGWKYFTNMTIYRAFIPILGPENFSNEYNYRDYLSYVVLINRTLIETPFDLPNGKVLEYQLLVWDQDSYGTFKGAEQTLLVYKIYCTPNTIIFLRPKWDIFTMQFPSASMWEVHRTWNNYLPVIRKDLLNRSNELLKKCPENKEVLKDYDLPSYSETEMLSVYWKVYYEYYFNLTSNLKIGAVPSTYNDKYLLKQINVSLTNNDFFELYDVDLKVSATPDGHSETDYFDNSVAGIFRPGDSISYNLSNKEVEFSKNIEVDVVLYTEEGKANIRPIKEKFTIEDFKKS